VSQSPRSNYDPGEADDPLEGRFVRYDLTAAQLALNPPMLVVYRVVGVAVSCMLVRFAWELRSVWSAWALAAFVMLLVSVGLRGFLATTQKGRTVRFRRPDAEGQASIVWEFDSANVGELSGSVPLRFLRRERGVLGTVVLRSTSGHSGILPKSAYEALVAQGMTEVPTQWGRK